MNKNLSFEYSPGRWYNDGAGMISLDNYSWNPGEKIVQKKEKTMENYKEKPFVVDSYRHFATLAEATAYARKCTMDRKEDTVIQQNIAVVKFPVPDYEVETLSV